MADVASPIINGILSDFKYVVETYEGNIDTIRKLEAETQDLLHEIELTKRKNASEGYYMYDELRRVREKRRELKDENESLEEMYQLYKCNEPFTNKLKKIQKNVDRIKERQTKRCYTPRVRKGEVISKVLKPQTEGAKLHDMLKQFKQDVRARSKHKYL